MIYPEDVFCSDRIKYIPITKNIDINRIHNFLSSKEMKDISDDMVLMEKSSTMEETEKFIEKEKIKARSGSKMTYILEERETGEFMGIGTISYNESLRRGIIGIVLRRKYWGRELSKERAIKFAEIIFEELEGESMISMCFIDNERAVKSINKYINELNGYYAGIKKDLIRKEGQKRDVHIFKVEKEDYYST